METWGAGVDGAELGGQGKCGRSRVSGEDTSTEGVLVVAIVWSTEAQTNRQMRLRGKDGFGKEDPEEGSERSLKKALTEPVIEGHARA